MKKTTSKELSKRLLQYSAMSAAALGVAEANGQIVYTDIADQVLNVGDMYDADLTGSGNVFTINNPAGLAGGNAAIVFPSSGGAFVGFSAYGFQYPLLMAPGDDIDAASGYTNTGIRGDLNYYGCAYSNSQWCGAVTDGYLGVSFQFSGNTHYGWIRLDTDVNGTNVIVVKDFAYNSVPGELIEAGQTLHLDEYEYNRIEHKFSNQTKKLTLDSQTVLTSLTVYNILGQEAMRVVLNSNHSETDMSELQAGVYIARIVGDNNASKTIKFVVK